MKKCREKLLLSRKANALLIPLNTVLREATLAGIDVHIFIRRDDPITGKAPIIYADFCKD